MKKRAISLLLCMAMLFSMSSNIFAAPQEPEHSHNQDGWNCTETTGETTQVCDLAEHTHSDGCYSTPEAPEATEPAGEGEGEGGVEVQSVSAMGLSPVLTCTETEHSHSAPCSVTGESTWDCVAPVEAPANKAPVLGAGEQKTPIEIARENYQIYKEVLVRVNGSKEKLTLTKFTELYEGKPGYADAMDDINNETFLFDGQDAKGDIYNGEGLIENAWPAPGSGIMTEQFSGTVQGEGYFTVEWEQESATGNPAYRLFAREVLTPNEKWEYDSKVIVAQVSRAGEVRFQNDAADGYTDAPKFTNVYKATITDTGTDKNPPHVKVHKEVVAGESAQLPEVMPTFTFEISDSNNTVVASGEVQGEGILTNFTWNPDVEIDQTETEIYQIKEVKENTPGWKYSEQVAYFKVKHPSGTAVYTDANGVENVNQKDPTFTNEYVGQTLPVVQVEKKIAGDTVPEGQMPTFKFQVTTAKDIKTVLAEATIQGEGTVDFVWAEGFTPEKNPKIVYQMKEVASTDTNWVYDTKTTKYFIIKADGTVGYAKDWTGTSISTTVPAFTNTYTALKNYKDLTGKKLVVKDDNAVPFPETYPDFEFVVKFKPAGSEMSLVAATAKRNGPGDFSFEWNEDILLKDGQTIYTVSEVKGNADRWTYSPANHYFVINQDGTMQFKAGMTSASANKVTPAFVEFTNTYTSKTGSYKLTVDVIDHYKASWDSGNEKFQFNFNLTGASVGSYVYKVNGVELGELQGGQINKVWLQKDDIIEILGLFHGATVMVNVDRGATGEYQNYRDINKSANIKSGTVTSVTYTLERRGSITLNNLSSEAVALNFAMEQGPNDAGLYALVMSSEDSAKYEQKNTATSYAGTFTLPANTKVTLYNLAIPNLKNNSYSLTGTDGQKLQYSFNGGELLETSNFTWQNGLTNEVFDHTITLYDPKVIIPPTLKNLNVFKQVVDASAGKTYTESRFDFTLTNKDEEGNVIATAKAMAIVPKNAAEPVELQLANDVKTLADGNYIITEDTLGSAYSANTQQFKVIVENNAVIGTMVWDATANNWVATEKAVFTNTYNGQTGGVDPGEPDDDRDPPEENIDDNRTPTTTPPTTTPPVEEEEIIDTAPPLTEAPLEEDLGEEEVPLTNLPKTGGLDMTVGLLGLFTVGSGMVLVRKKDENEGKKKIDTTGSDQ